MATAVERFQAPTGGVDLESGPATMPRDCARHLENLLVHRPGVAPLRGPLGDPAVCYGSVNAVTGIWTFNNVVMVSDYPTSKHADMGVGSPTVTDVAVASDYFTLLGRSARVGDYAYGPTVPGTKKLLRFDGTATTPVALAAGPADATCVEAHLERLFVGGGVSPAGGSSQPNALYWSDQGGPTTAAKAVTGVAATDIFTSVAHGYSNGDRVQFTAITGGAGLVVGTVYYVIAAAADTFQVSATSGGAAVNFTTDLTAGTITRGIMDWQDDTSGLTNQILVGSPGDPIVALASVGRQLLILKRYSVYTLVGGTPSTFEVRRLANSLGCKFDGWASAFIVTDDCCVFVSQDGPVLYDGASFTRLGRNGPKWPATPTLPITVARLSSDYYVFTGKTETWLFYLPTQAWTILSARTSILDSSRVYMAVTTEKGIPVSFDGLSLRTMTNVASPDTAVQTGREKDSAGVYQPINAKWITRLARLAKPLQKAVVRRTYVDHRTLVASGSADGWTATPSDGTGTARTAAAVPASVSSSSAFMESHLASEIHGEMPDITLTVERIPTTLPPPAMVAVELRDLWVEHDSAQR